jgi:hypothetical protein
MLKNITLRQLRDAANAIPDANLDGPAILYVLPSAFADHGLLVNISGITSPSKDTAEEFNLPKDFSILTGSAE